jgi:hypothetical protein
VGLESDHPGCLAPADVGADDRSFWNGPLLCLLVRINGYDFLLRSSSFEYLVPFPVSSSASPLSVI